MISAAAMGADVSSRTFQASDGVRLHVLESGPHGGPARVLAFVPGWSMPAAIFRDQLAPLGKRHPVAVLDPRGQGESEVPGTGYTLRRRSTDIAEFVARYPRVVLVGWSLGALESLEYVRLHGTARIDALVLVDSSVGEKPVPRGGGSLVAELRRDRAATLDQFVRGIFRQPQPEERIRALQEQALRMPLGASLSLFPASVPRQHWRRIARAFRKPLLYAVTPRYAAQGENLRRARPATRLEVFGDAGHALFADEPDRFNELLESFVAGLPG